MAALLGIVLAGCGGFRISAPSGDEIESINEAAAEKEQELPPAPSGFDDFTLGPGDQVAIRVFRHPDLTRQITIPPSGMISYPLAGELKAGGLTAWALRSKLAERLDGYVVDPQVEVEVTLWRSTKVTVLGEVNNPGTFTMREPMRVIEAVSLASGFRASATHQTIFHLRTTDKEIILHVLNMQELIEKGDLAQNPVMQAGDIVYVPPSALAEGDTLARHITTWLSPIISLENAVLLGQSINDSFGAASVTVSTPIILPAAP